MRITLLNLGVMCIGIETINCKEDVQKDGKKGDGCELKSDLENLNSYP
jgi:hypothetical protein